MIKTVLIDYVKVLKLYNISKKKTWFLSQRKHSSIEQNEHNKRNL